MIKDFFFFKKKKNTHKLAVVFGIGVASNFYCKSIFLYKKRASMIVDKSDKCKFEMNVGTLHKFLKTPLKKL